MNSLIIKLSQLYKATESASEEQSTDHTYKAATFQKQAKGYVESASNKVPHRKSDTASAKAKQSATQASSTVSKKKHNQTIMLMKQKRIQIYSKHRKVQHQP